MRALLISTFTALFLSGTTFAQSPIFLSTSDGTPHEDLMHVMQIQGIHMTKVKINGDELAGKNYKINLKDFSNGKLVATHLIFDSNKDELFKFKEKEFGFNVLIKRMTPTTMRVDFRFSGFSVTKNLEVKNNHTDFLLKSFQKNLDGIAIDMNKPNHFLALMMPYQLPNQATRYADVANANIKPEDLGNSFPIPRYFLVEIEIN